MRNKYKYIIISLLSALILYGGAGITSISYCCSGCDISSILATNKTKSCCSETKTDSHTIANASESYQGETCCEVNRITFEWEHTKTVDFSFSKQTLECDYIYFTSPIWCALDELNIQSYLSDKPPFVVPPRAYLNLLTTLII